MTDEVKKDVIAYLEETKPVGVSVDRIDGDTDLIGSGVIDSFGVVGFIEFLEEQYGIEVDDDDIDPDNFRTIARIVEYIAAERQPDQ